MKGHAAALKKATLSDGSDHPSSRSHYFRLKLLTTGHEANACQAEK